MYIADFYSHQAKLVIEVDGGIHDTDIVKKRDEEKATYLLEKAYTVLRIKNKEIMHDIENVRRKITTIVNNNIHQQSPKIGG